MAHLVSLYAGSPDPWGFRTSAYERNKHQATVAALCRPRYRAVLEVGCGNGELGKRLSGISDRYVGLDAVERAIAEAKAAVPNGTFHQAFFPCRLPAGAFDLIVVSEFLYFLDPSAVADLAGQIKARWPGTEILCVNYLGSTGHELQGHGAADLFVRALRTAFRRTLQEATSLYRIDRFAPARQNNLAR